MHQLSDKAFKSRFTLPSRKALRALGKRPAIQHSFFRYYGDNKLQFEIIAGGNQKYL